MSKSAILFVLCSMLFFLISGCTVKTYPVIKDRVDQDLSTGNRGYLFGKPAVIEEKPRATTRKVQIVEVEFRPLQVEGGPKPSVPAQEISRAPEEIVAAKPEVVVAPITPAEQPSKAIVMKRYKVQKNDTLQKISKKFYGTTKRWKELYNVNREVLKGPDEIYPGQIIEIPIEEIPGTK